MTNSQDPAYPLPSDSDTPGLTIREYFAGLALQGIMSQPENGAQHIPQLVAEWAVSCADALISELNKS